MNGEILMNLFKLILFLSFIFLYSCASRQINITSSGQGQVFVDNKLVCSSFPCTFSKSCMQHSDVVNILIKTEINEIPMLATGPCHVGDTNRVNLHANILSKEEAEILKDKVSKCRKDKDPESCFSAARLLQGKNIRTARELSDDGCLLNHSQSCKLSELLTRNINENNNAMIQNQINEAREQQKNEALSRELLNNAKNIQINPIQKNKENSDSWGNMTCGLKPMAKINCYIGRCVNGSWEEICN